MFMLKVFIVTHGSVADVHKIAYGDEEPMLTKGTALISFQSCTGIIAYNEWVLHFWNCRLCQESDSGVRMM